MTRRIEVAIDELVLVGFRREDSHAIAAGLERELTRQFSDAALVPQLLTHAPGMAGPEAPMVHLRRGVRAAEIGSAVARGIGARLRT